MSAIGIVATASGGAAAELLFGVEETKRVRLQTREQLRHGIPNVRGPLKREERKEGVRKK